MTNVPHFGISWNIPILNNVHTSYILYNVEHFSLLSSKKSVWHFACYSPFLLSFCFFIFFMYIFKTEISMVFPCNKNGHPNGSFCDSYLFALPSAPFHSPICALSLCRFYAFAGRGTPFPGLVRIHSFRTKKYPAVYQQDTFFTRLRCSDTFLKFFQIRECRSGMFFQCDGKRGHLLSLWTIMFFFLEPPYRVVLKITGRQLYVIKRHHYLLIILSSILEFLCKDSIFFEYKRKNLRF